MDMNIKNTYAIGLMSGTSLDGLDIVYVQFVEKGNLNFEIIHSKTISYNKHWKEELRNSIHKSHSEIKILDEQYGVFLGDQVNRFVEEYKISSLDFVASHGHTIFHQPEKGYTLQIGDGQKISDLTNCIVVNDFRTQDVELGGQGAPLVPIGDQILFSDYDACINLGGFANISFEKDGLRHAFDICPVNVVLNHYSNKLGFEFDNQGKLSASGKLNDELLTQLNAIPFYEKEHPKSLGIEWVHEFIFPIFTGQLPEIDVMRTFLEHIAMQIGKAINGFNKVLFTGGGVYNSFLLERIRVYSTNEIIVPNDQIINYKEALIFALLGSLRLKNKVNCLASVTGAKRDHCSGRIFHPNNSL